MEYDSAIKKKEILPFMTTWVDPVCWVKWRKTDTRCAYLYVKSKKKTTQTHSNGFLVWGVGEIVEENQKIQTYSYKLNHGFVMYSMVTIVNDIVYLKVVKDMS